MLLHACPGGVVLKVEQVLHIPGQRNHPNVEVRTLKVRHGLKTLLPYGVLLISNLEKCDRQCCSSGEAVLAQGGEGHVRNQLNAGVRLAVDDGLDHGSMGLKGIVMLTSHWSMPWVVDS
jgi:hypothetical protein